MANGVIALLLSALPLMGSPGPATLSLASVGSAYGFSRSLPYLAGIISGTIGALVLISFGFAAVIAAQPNLMKGLKLVAFAYILHLAWKIAHAPTHPATSQHTTPPSLVAGFLLALANPKAYAAIAAVFSTHRRIMDDAVSDSIAKVAVLSAAVIMINTGWLCFGKMLSSVLGNPRHARIANLGFAMLLVGSVALALSGSRHV
ncbi:MAG: LysE family translocator [Pseudomonadota bacterium]